MRKLYFLLCFVAFSLLCFAEDSEKRVALIIGNQDYSGTEYNSLNNPVNDAKGMEEALKDMGFTISSGKALINANKDQMLEAIEQFRYDSRGATIAIFYYSGHGVTYDQDNLMLPVGKKFGHVYTERCVKLNTVREQMEKSGALLNIIILDACRSAIRNGGKGGESMNNGLLRTEIPEGFLYCYATSKNEEALDRPNGKYSYFTEALITQMKDHPNQKFGDMYQNVKKQVLKATNNQQRPTINNEDGGTLDFYLSPQPKFTLSPVGEMKLTYEDLSRKRVYEQPDSAISGRISYFFTQLSVIPNSTFTDTVWFKQVKPDGKVETCSNCEIMKNGYSYGKVYSFVKGESQLLSFGFGKADGSWNPGIYSFELWHGKKKLASKPLTIKPAPTQDQMNTNIRVDKTTLEANRDNPKIREVVFESGKLKFVPRDYKGEFIIGNDVTAIGDSAFKGCSGLTSVTIPNSVTSIGSYAFKGCSGLTSVTIPNSVTSIGRSAFERCSGLTSVTIPNSVTSIDSYAFSGCLSISKPLYNNTIFVFLPRTYKGTYAIPDGIQVIANSAFASCINLTDLIIPNSVTDVDYYAFDNCKNILRPLYNDSVFFYLPQDYKGTYELPSGIKKIATTAFANCKNLIGIVIPNSVTSIGSSAFVYCSGLTSVTIPNSVTSIGRSAFSDCSGLKSVTIPNSVTSIGRSAFSDCSGLTSVTIPNSVTSIDDWAFSGCSGLTSVTIPNSVTSIGWYAFARCSGLTSVTIMNAKIKIGYFSFSECPSLKKIFVPKGAKASIQKQLSKEQRHLVKER